MVPEAQLDAYNFHEQEWDSYQQLYDEFEWEIPEEFNIATYVCDRWAEESDRIAVYAEKASGESRTVTFNDLCRDANALANALKAKGIGRGDRVAVNAPQKPETLIAHLATWKLGAVSVPLSILFGEDAIRYRLQDAGASACIVDEANIDTGRSVFDQIDLETVLTIDIDQPQATETDLRTAVESNSTHPRRLERRQMTLHLLSIPVARQGSRKVSFTTIRCSSANSRTFSVRYATSNYERTIRSMRQLNGLG